MWRDQMEMYLCSMWKQVILFLTFELRQVRHQLAFPASIPGPARLSGVIYPCVFYRCRLLYHFIPLGPFDRRAQRAPP